MASLTFCGGACAAMRSGNTRSKLAVNITAGLNTSTPNPSTYFQSGFMSEPPSVSRTGYPPEMLTTYNSQGPRSEMPWQ